MKDKALLYASLVIGYFVDVCIRKKDVPEANEERVVTTPVLQDDISRITLGKQ